MDIGVYLHSTPTKSTCDFFMSRSEARQAVVNCHADWINKRTAIRFRKEAPVHATACAIERPIQPHRGLSARPDEALMQGYAEAKRSKGSREVIAAVEQGIGRRTNN